MVILGGLEVVAAGYLIHKHQKNKKERERVEDDKARLEEEQYHLFPPQQDHRPHSHHRRRSHSRRRHSHERPHSHDGRYKHDPPASKPILKPSPAPIPTAQSMHAPPPRYETHASAQAPPPHPQDVKYGWNDPAPAPPPQQQSFPVTGWPQEWEQSQRSASNTHLAAPKAPYPHSESSRGSSRGRSETRRSEPEHHVRFAVSDDRGRAHSPPPRYRP